MFDLIGFSEDLYQHHTGIGDAEAMRDLRFTMGQLLKDLNGEFLNSNRFDIPRNTPKKLQTMMNKAKKDLIQSITYRQYYAKKSLSDEVPVSGSKEDFANNGNQLQNSVEEQLRQIQSMLPEGIKYSSWAEVYDPND